MPYKIIRGSLLGTETISYHGRKADAVKKVNKLYALGLANFKVIDLKTGREVYFRGGH